MKRRCLPRSVHGALCGLAILLVLAFLRAAYGPPPVFGEEAILRRTERQYLRAPGTVAAQWDDRNEHYFAVWDGSEVLVYYTPWENSTTFFGPERVPKPKPVVHRYRSCWLLQNSAVRGWGCPMERVSVLKGERWASALPLLVKNGDPAAVRGEITVSGMNIPLEGAAGAYRWTAEARRDNPWFFVFTVTTEEYERYSRLWGFIRSGSDMGLGVTAEAEIVWYDASGAELGRQAFSLLAEGGEGSGA
ncbi:MAG: hypothetical protein IKP17_04835 [Oscillospiraceae bacterium]|nr:hypothetical protein [Oscillospiraceae bacterium]